MGDAVQDLAPGDTVRRISAYGGGPLMTVTEVTARGAYCSWPHPVLGPQEMCFPLAELQRATR